jgi:hypothetical protein
MSHAHHFLTRLDRLADQSQLEVAKFLHNHPDLVQLVLQRVNIPSECSRVAISLSDPVDGPWVITTREGAFVTCLADGMKPKRETMTVMHDVLFDAMLEHDTLHNLGWVVHEGIEPHASRVARAHENGEVALVFLAVHSSSADAARMLGWRGGYRECISMNRTRAERFADALPSDDPCSKWLRGRRRGRIFVMVEAGNYCVNYKPVRGYSIEPGTTDREVGLIHQPSAERVAQTYLGRARAGRTS